MFILHSVIFFSFFFVCLFYLVNLLLSYSYSSRSKVGAYECGFATVGKIQSSFSIHFFVIMLLFVLFDLEVVMFVGVLVTDVNSLSTFLLLVVFIAGGFYMEWWYGKLRWVV
nr:NADH dehydrogenase subunit 3 [Strongyloides fuelleborni fuelleborni]